MKVSRKWLFVIVSGLLVAAIALGGFSLATVTPAEAATTDTNVHRGRLFPGADIDYNALMADALGITVDELEAAQQKLTRLRLIWPSRKACLPKMKPL